MEQFQTLNIKTALFGEMGYHTRQEWLNYKPGYCAQTIKANSYLQIDPPTLYIMWAVSTQEFLTEEELQMDQEGKLLHKVGSLKY